MAIQVKTQLEVERYRPLAARGLHQPAGARQLRPEQPGQPRLDRRGARESRQGPGQRGAGRGRPRQGPRRRGRRPGEHRAVPGRRLAEAQLNLGWTKVQSPITGMAGIKKASIGDLVGPADGAHHRGRHRSHLRPVQPQRAGVSAVAGGRERPAGPAPGLRADPLRRAGLSASGYGRDPRAGGRPHHRDDRRPGQVSQPGEPVAPRPVRKGPGSPHA